MVQAEQIRFDWRPLRSEKSIYVRTTPLVLFDPLNSTTSPPQQNVFARFFAKLIQLPNYLPSLFHFVPRSI